MVATIILASACLTGSALKHERMLSEECFMEAVIQRSFCLKAAIMQLLCSHQ
jgi:hypothetical protein